MKLIESFLVNNPCYKKGTKLTVKGLTLHSIGCAQPNAMVFVKNWNSATCKDKCVHGFIDANDGTVYQTLPWTMKGWHAGKGSKGSANNSHIGIEMCEPSGIKYTSGANFTIINKEEAIKSATTTYNSAVELFAQLCKEFKLDPMKDGVIISHQEGSTLGIASNHVDPEHLWKGLGLSYTMDTFRKDVKVKMEPEVVSEEPKPVIPEKTGTFKVRVDIPNLCIRTGAGTNYKSVGYTGVGVFTITSKKSGTGSKTGWGHLKSGAGWISLDYAKKI